MQEKRDIVGEKRDVKASTMEEREREDGAIGWFIGRASRQNEGCYPAGPRNQSLYHMRGRKAGGGRRKKLERAKHSTCGTKG